MIQIMPKKLKKKDNKITIKPKKKNLDTAL